MQIKTFAAALLFGLMPVRLPNGTQPVPRRVKPRPLFDYEARDSAGISRWTGRPHTHAREINRRRQQAAHDRRTQRLRANYLGISTSLEALAEGTVPVRISRRWSPVFETAGAGMGVAAGAAPAEAA